MKFLNLSGLLAVFLLSSGLSHAETVIRDAHLGPIPVFLSPSGGASPQNPVKKFALSQIDLDRENYTMTMHVTSNDPQSAFPDFIIQTEQFCDCPNKLDEFANAIKADPTLTIDLLLPRMFCGSHENCQNNMDNLGMPLLNWQISTTDRIPKPKNLFHGNAGKFGELNREQVRQEVSKMGVQTIIEYAANIRKLEKDNKLNENLACELALALLPPEKQIPMYTEILGREETPNLWNLSHNSGTNPALVFDANEIAEQQTHFAEKCIQAHFDWFRSPDHSAHQEFREFEDANGSAEYHLHRAYAASHLFEMNMLSRFDRQRIRNDPSFQDRYQNETAKLAQWYLLHFIRTFEQIDDILEEMARLKDGPEFDSLSDAADRLFVEGVTAAVSFTHLARYHAKRAVEEFKMTNDERASLHKINQIRDVVIAKRSDVLN